MRDEYQQIDDESQADSTGVGSRMTPLQERDQRLTKPLEMFLDAVCIYCGNFNSVLSCRDGIETEIRVPGWVASILSWPFQEATRSCMP